MFNENFKKYRKLAGMTQEEVASFLMVTPQAVSKWETGNATPDISLLVPIAEIFGISTDELLGNTIKANGYLTESECSDGTFEEKYKKYQSLLKYNPTNADILSKLLTITAEWLCSERGKMSPEKTEMLISAAEDYAERLRSKSDRCNMWAESHSQLADVYMSAGNFAAAKKEAEYLPSARYTQNRIKGNLAHREKDYEKSRDFYRESATESFIFLLWDLERIAGTYNPAFGGDFTTDRIIFDKIYRIEYDMIHALGTSHPAIMHHLCNASIRLAQRAVWDKDYDRAFELLDEFMSTARILKKGISESESSPAISNKTVAVKPISKGSILCRLSWNAFNPIRTDPRFEKYIEEIESWD